MEGAKGHCPFASSAFKLPKSADGLRARRFSSHIPTRGSSLGVGPPSPSPPPLLEPPAAMLRPPHASACGGRGMSQLPRTDNASGGVGRGGGLWWGWQ